jgi:hypothetical protein
VNCSVAKLVSASMTMPPSEPPARAHTRSWTSLSLLNAGGTAAA